ncbi:MAG TPA: MarR family transcriptional regulator [Polyangiales bacterium]|nr:MarR family transcriptional regulator [Polyangiales bacterium]
MSGASKASKSVDTLEANPAADKVNGSWTFLSNHAHVLVCLARDPDVRLREIADRVGITERGVFRVITELEQGGVITRIKEGRRNHYRINVSAPLRHHLESARTVGGLLNLLLDPDEAERLALASSEPSH